MANKIVQLQDESGDNIFPVAGGLASGSVTTSTINNGAVTADKLNLSYSTSEQSTGEKWVDGSPIYRKAYVGTWSGTSGTATRLTLQSSFNIIPVKIGGAVEYTSGGWVPMPYSESDNEWTYIYHQASSNDLKLAIKGGTVSNLRYRVWVEYVKV